MTVNVRVRLLGIYRGLFGKSHIALELDEPTVREVVQKMADSLPPEAKTLLIDPELNDPRPNALIIVNGREISALKGMETTLQEGDELTLIPISHGG